MEDSPDSPHPVQSTATAPLAVQLAAPMIGRLRVATHAGKMRGGCRLANALPGCSSFVWRRLAKVRGREARRERKWMKIRSRGTLLAQKWLHIDVLISSGFCGGGVWRGGEKHWADVWIKSRPLWCSYIRTCHTLKTNQPPLESWKLRHYTPNKSNG